MTKKPIHILKGIQSLTQNELEKRILESDIDIYFQDKSYSKEKIELFFDLSQVRWVNIAAAFQLCLLIEKLKKNNIKVYIALPLRVVTNAGLSSKNVDQNTLTSIALKRAKANDFLRVIHFDKAVLCEHIDNKPSVHISEDFQFSKEELNLEYFNEVFSKENNSYTPISDYYDFKYNYIFPLKWISETPENYTELSSQIEKILSNEERGIHYLDILSLKNVILSELIKNVRQHSGSETKHALFCIGLLKTTSIHLKKQEQETLVHSNVIEDGYLKGLLESNIMSNIEILFGDSGVGLCSKELFTEYKKLNHSSKSIINSENELIKWSFDKWSTSKKNEDIRGTKGLYRVHRIVNKYNGIIHLRTSFSDAGYQKGGKNTSTFISSKNKKYKHPGTFVQIKLCPNKEVLKYNIKTSTDNHSIQKKWKTATYNISKQSIDSEVFANEFKKLLIGDFDNIILVLIKDNSLEINYENTQNLGEILLKISELRHPKGVLLYNALSIGRETLETIVDSANNMIFERNHNIINPENINPDFEEVYDPVLVFGEDGIINWYGASKNVNNILKEVVFNPESKNQLKLSELKSYKELGNEEQIAILKNFQNDDSFINIFTNEEIIFDFTNVIDIYQKELNELIEKNSNFNKICSPKLDFGTKWIDFKSILNKENSTGFALALYSIIIEKESKPLNTVITTIFIDHQQQYKLAEELARLIGLEASKIINISEDIDFNLPRRTKLFNESDKVLILTTIISSSETTRRLVKQVLRDKAKPIAIITLLNINEESENKIRTWENFTEIYSLNKKTHNPKKINAKLEYDDKFKLAADNLHKNVNSTDKLIIYSPTYEIESESSIEFKLSEPLVELFNRTNSLHYDHLGRYNDRHYTFFLDKKKILMDAEIQKKVKEEIFNWISTNNIDNCVFIVPNKNFNALKTIINYLGLKNIKIIHLKDVSSQNYITPKNVVFFDFGTITGNTIDDVLISNSCKENLLILTVFSQLRQWKTKLYKNITTVKSEYDYEERNKQTSLFTQNEESSRTLVTNINVSFINLFELPIYFYHSIHCPICQHSEALEYYKLKKSKYLKSFANDRKDKLKIKSQENIPKTPIDPYGTSQNHSEHIMSNDIVIKMYEFKRLLELSLEFTHFRLELFNKLYDIESNKENQIKNKNSYLFAFIYLLSYEIIWFQKEPLILRIFRYLAYCISKYIAEYDINELTSILSNGNKKLGFNLATRYKYAAVTVFRSSNKFKFTESIFNIINTSIINDTEPYIGNNIFQNTFYHINSIHINQHNNSEKYYENIESELSRLLENPIPLSNTAEREQLNTIKIVKYNNSKNQKLITLYKLEQVDLFKKLKKNILDVYDGKGNHPWPSDFFLSIQIDDSVSLLDDIIKNKENATAYDYFLKFQKDLRSNYDKLSTFINIEIIPYLDFIESKKNHLLNSYSYKKLKSYYFTYVKGLSSFESLIEVGNQNILELIENHRDYIHFCEIINEAFIHKEDVNKAELFKLFKSVPTNIKNSVTHIFEDSEFKKCTIDIEDNLQGFICEIVLKRELSHILKNAIKRQNHNFDELAKKPKTNIINDLSNCSINIKTNSNKESIELIIEYNNTDKFKTTLNPSGNLNDLKNELIKWDGSAEWELLENGLFQVKLNIINYGK